VTFPGGETMAEMVARSSAAVRRRDAALADEHGAEAVWVAVSHGDIIKGILADALGMHLDLFQRINIDPGSVSIVRYTSARPYVLGMNTHAGDLAWLNPRPRRTRRRSSGAAVGGGAGPGTPT
jgi:broad specificity phosphatase PhoE